MIQCDGCPKEVPVEDLKFAAGLGHVLRYCSECFTQYQALLAKINKERDRVQKRLDAYELKARRETTLRVTPLDLPRLALGKDGQPVVLK